MSTLPMTCADESDAVAADCVPVVLDMLRGALEPGYFDDKCEECFGFGFVEAGAVCSACGGSGECSAEEDEPHWRRAGR